jgi:hypothetical protein
MIWSGNRKASERVIKIVGLRATSRTRFVI